MYILRCADETLYTGITTDLERRIRQHNGEIVGGAKYTRVRRPVSLFWQEEHLDRSSASKREYEIKRLSRQKKENLVES
ncbi:GIY-YIG nuclease family protein [Neptuniibacter sp. QD37_6]|uniref:GIY-YIG nuclease family protein n=1 Tax=Neptuniibacter sp. QD37_6 TaxID=3398210 RepID=UPI0039F4F0B8